MTSAEGAGGNTNYKLVAIVQHGNPGQATDSWEYKHTIVDNNKVLHRLSTHWCTVYDFTCYRTTD